MRENNLSSLKEFSPSLLITSLNVCAPNWGETNCSYNYHKFYYFQGGEATLTVNQDIFYPKKNELYLIPAGVKHTYSHTADNPVYKYWCHFSISPTDVFHLNYNKDSFFICPNPDIVIPLFEQMIKAYNNSSFLASIQQKYLLTKLCYIFFSNTNLHLLINESKSDFNNIVNNYIKEHIANKISLQDLADLTHLQKNYFIAKFKNEFGCTPIDYINTMRLDCIGQYLNAHPDINIGEAALLYGFEDYRYFSRLFKKRYGLTPSSFRSSMDVSAST